MFFRLFLLFTLTCSSIHAREYPHTLAEAKLFLETGEIDSTEYEITRMLLIQPVEPLFEGWERLYELYDIRGTISFPDLNEIRRFLEIHTETELWTTYPSLQPFRNYLLFERSEPPLLIRGTLYSRVYGQSERSTAHMYTGGAVMSTVSVVGGNWLVSVDSMETKLVQRSFSMKKRKVRLELGNVMKSRRPLVWGNFTPSSDSLTPLEELLYGTTAHWNGGATSIQVRELLFECYTHQRYRETIYGGKIVLPLWLSKGTVEYQYQEKSDTTQSLVVSELSGDNLTIELMIADNGGMASFSQMEFKGSVLSLSNDVWFVNQRYCVPFSSTCDSLIDRYGARENTVLGTEVTTETRLAEWCLIFGGKGEMSGDQGKSELHCGVRFPRGIPVKTKTKSSWKMSDTLSTQRIEQTVSFRPELNAIALGFPLDLLGERLDDGTKRAAVGLGIEWKPESALLGVSVWQPLGHDDLRKTKISTEAGIRGQYGKSAFTCTLYPDEKDLPVTITGRIVLNW